MDSNSLTSPCAQQQPTVFGSFLGAEVYRTQWKMEEQHHAHSSFPATETRADVGNKHEIIYGPFQKAQIR